MIETHNAFRMEFLVDADDEELSDFLTRDVGQQHAVLEFDL